ncbi:hypothetical protein BOTU111921_01620 [Bordetella tumbae]|uniref:hypothetical protein n=1 Tax=Bordetella tumbae TaxID=1649139 RepID=UPI0039EF0DA3
MTVVTALKPFDFHENYAPPKASKKSQDSANTLRPNLDSFVREDYSPVKMCAAAVVDNAEPSLLDSWVEIKEQSLLDSWVATEIDSHGTLEQPFDALRTATRKGLEGQTDPTQISAESPRSWRSAFTAPLVGMYNAATGTVQGWVGNNAPQSIQQLTPGQRIERAAELAYQIEVKLQRLDESICKTHGIKLSTPDAARIDSVQLSTWDSLQNFSARTQGAVTAILDTTVGVASGVAIGGVGATGILGIGFGAAALSGGTILALTEMRKFPERAQSRGVQNVLNDRLPEIQKDLDELDAIIGQEQHRWAMQQRIMATISQRYDHCGALERQIIGAVRARARIEMACELENGMPVSVAHRDDPTRNAVLTQLAQTRDALYNFIASLIQEFNALSERMLFTLHVSEAAAHAKAEKNAEEAFKNAHRALLLDLSTIKNSTLAADVDVIALQNLENSGTSTKVTDTALRADIAIGQNLTRTILSSGPNFGAVKYAAKIGAHERNYAVPSNLTTVRSIARYIDAQAISNARNPSAAATAPTLSQGQDGSYTIADPERKLYSFLASAPTARANFSDTADVGPSAKLIDAGIGRMTIADYSRTFPGGANQMEFEPKIDKSGAHVLTVRFLNQPDESLFRPHQATALDIIKNQRKRLATEQEQTPVETSDFTGMSLAEVEAYLDDMALVCEEQAQLLHDDYRQLAALNQWENPTFTRRA